LILERINQDSSEFCKPSDYIRYNQVRTCRVDAAFGKMAAGRSAEGAVNKTAASGEKVDDTGTFGRYWAAIGGFLAGISQETVRKNRVFRAGRGMVCCGITNLPVGRAWAGRISSMPYLPAGQ
jgi:hypothetical protein